MLLDGDPAGNPAGKVLAESTEQQIEAASWSTGAQKEWAIQWAIAPGHVRPCATARWIALFAAPAGVLVCLIGIWSLLGPKLK